MKTRYFYSTMNVSLYVQESIKQKFSKFQDKEMLINGKIGEYVGNYNKAAQYYVSWLKKNNDNLENPNELLKNNLLSLTTTLLKSDCIDECRVYAADIIKKNFDLVDSNDNNVLHIIATNSDYQDMYINLSKYQSDLLLSDLLHQKNFLNETPIEVAVSNNNIDFVRLSKTIPNYNLTNHLSKMENLDYYIYLNHFCNHEMYDELTSQKLQLHIKK